MYYRQTKKALSTSTMLTRVFPCWRYKITNAMLYEEWKDAHFVWIIKIKLMFKILFVVDGIMPIERTIIKHD